MRNSFQLVAAAGLILAVTGMAGALPVTFTLEEKSFSELGVTGPATSLLAETFSYSTTLSGTLCSQVFDLSSGKYLYLYQVDNDGPSIVEKLVVFPFLGLDAGGLLTGSMPTGFLAGGLAPAGASYDADIPEPTVGWDYPSSYGKQIPAGENSRALYLISPGSPTLGEAHVIDGGTGTVVTYVAIPEPLTAWGVFLGISGLAGYVRRRAAGREARNLSQSGSSKGAIL